MKLFGLQGSIRTRFGILTGCILLFLLLAFYVIGRYVLIHMLRNVEQEIQVAGMEVRNAVNGNFMHLRQTARRLATDIGRQVAAGGTPEAVLLLSDAEEFSDDALRMVVLFGPDGDIRTSAWRPRSRRTGILPIPKGTLQAYGEELPSMIREARTRGTTPIGMMNVDGMPLYVSLAAIKVSSKEETFGYVLIGAQFNRLSLLDELSSRSGGMQVGIAPTAPHKPQSGTVARKEGGIAPVFSDTVNYYSGGDWHFGDNAFETVLPLYDISGIAISSVSIQLPRGFASVTHVALGWLTALIATVGIVFILPVFWLQSKVLLNPLTDLAGKIREVGNRHSSRECGRVEWPADDEFGQVATSINGMLETISRKNVQLEQAERTQRSVLAAVPDGLCVFDHDGCLVRVRKHPDGVAPVPGLEEGHPLPSTSYGKDGCAGFKKALAEAFTDDRLRKVTLQTGTGEGARVFRCRIRRMDGFFALVLFSDITQRTAEHQKLLQAETRLAQVRKQESLTAFSAGLAHDINNSLAIISSTLESMFCDTTDAKNREILEVVRDTIGKGAAIAQDLMTFAGETSLVLRPQDPNRFLHGTERLLLGVLSQGHSVTLRFGKDLPWAAIDPAQLWKVFVNLVKNASEAMSGQKGEITVTTSAYDLTEKDAARFFCTHPLTPGPGIVFIVSDTGPGIPQDVLTHLFEPFYSTKSTSRGLGMATVFALVDAHGGAVDVRSELGRGTEFRIWLPAIRPQIEDPAPPHPLPSPQNGIPEAFGCLLIDDDPAILSSAKLLFERIFHARVFVARSRFEALGIFRRNQQNISVILLDAFIESADTARLVKPLRMCREDIPIIIVSGHPKAQIEELFADVAYDAYLPKPYTLVDLREILAHIFPGTR